MGTYDCKFAWPDGAHIAVVFNMSWETWERKLGTSENNQKTSERVPPHAKYGRGMRWIYEHAYAESGGMQRLLDMWRRHGIRTSTYADGHTVQLFPALAKAAAAEGHEFLVQGWEHNYLWDQTVEEQADGMDRTMKVFKENGIEWTGFSSPGGHLTAETFSLCVERGFKYCCGLRNVDVPFIMYVGGRKLVGQTSYAISDFSSYSTGDMVPRDVTNTWRDCFDALYDEGERGYPKMLAFGTHPILAHGYRTRPIEDLIRYVKSKPKVWITTRGEITDWLLENYPDHDLSKFYPEAVASDRYYGLGIGLGGKEALEEAASYRKGWPQNK
jgi:peptidoglycan/xylan/chitin deacetylase (PgdA/CDA1 family)